MDQYTVEEYANLRKVALQLKEFLILTGRDTDQVVEDLRAMMAEDLDEW